MSIDVQTKRLRNNNRESAVRAHREVYTREIGTDGAFTEDFIREHYRGALREYWGRAFEKYYRGEIEVDGKRVALIELPKEYLPANVLGMTDCFSAIWMRNDLDDVFGYGARKRVLGHEKEHVRDPLAGEHEVRERTNTVRWPPYSMN